MFLPVYLIIFASIPYFFEKFDEKDTKLHLYLTIFFILFLSTMSNNGVDISTYRKNYFENETLIIFKFPDLVFNFLTVMFGRLELSFFFYQFFVKSIFIFGLFIFLKDLFKKKLEYLLVVIFASMYLIPVISINSIYQSAALGLFLILTTFKNFNLLRDLPIILVVILMHKSGIAALALYSINYIFQFRRKKIFKILQIPFIVLFLIFTIIYFWNLDLISKIVHQKLIILDDKISPFHYFWALVYAICLFLFLISKKEIKKRLSYKDYNFLISSILYIFFIIFIYQISKQYALRFFYYEFVFFMIMISLISSIKILNYEKFKNYFLITYICGSLFFVSLWYHFANERFAFREYKIFSNIQLLCKRGDNCFEEEYRNFNLFKKLTKDYPNSTRQY